jgi:hypothetical protein
MAKPIYRVISTGELVIEVGFDVNVTPSRAQVDSMFEFLDEDTGKPTGVEESFSWDELEELSRN